MIGLDAVSLPFVRANLDRLPTLASLLKDGSLRELETPATHLSASVWPTFSTGKQPGDHGQYFPFQWHGGNNHYRRIADSRWSDEFEIEPYTHGAQGLVVSLQRVHAFGPLAQLELERARLVDEREGN